MLRANKKRRRKTRGEILQTATERTMNDEERMKAQADRMKLMFEDARTGLDPMARTELTRMNTTVGDDTIDTCDTCDSGWESAVVNHVMAEKEGCSSVCILEQYDTEEEARIGHEKWVQYAKDGVLDKQITISNEG